MELDKKKLIKCIVIPIAVGGVAGFLTSNGMAEFARLKQPPLSPPGWLFPVAWTILYVLMGIASYLVLESEAEPEAVTNAIHIYFYQLVVNFLWPVFFFLFVFVSPKGAIFLLPELPFCGILVEVFCQKEGLKKLL